MHTFAQQQQQQQASSTNLAHQQQQASIQPTGNMTDDAPDNLYPDAFDGSAEPVVYMSENRMPAMIEFNSALIYIVFAALALALVAILPGIRRTKVTSCLGLTSIILVGGCVLLALDGSYWLTGSVVLSETPYGALTSETFTGRLDVNIGLASANVTLVGQLVGDNNSTNRLTIGGPTATTSKHVDYNERFHWDQPDKMAKEHEEALRKGLPYPILTITEFLSQDSDGFSWTRQLRLAGYYTTFVLYTSLAAWSLTIVVMCALPVYLPHMMQITGALIMSSVWLYTLLIQSPKSFVIQVGAQQIEFAFGFSYVSTFSIGAMSVFAGVLLFLLQINKPNEQITIMDSENFLKNQTAASLYGKNICTSIFSATKLSKHNNEASISNNNNSVIVPIADIEEIFRPIETSPPNAKAS